MTPEPPRAAIAQPAANRAVRFVPHADLGIVDPVVTTAYITRIHAFLAYDTLYGMDEKFRKTPLGLRTMLAYKKELSKLEDLYPAKRHLHGSDPDNPLPETTTQVSIFQIPDNNR